nr:integrase, catalytic region, zinc finger, CCHC-type, peptidase aspartic, catalytic [Tanacetum cinerariifolium]
MSTQQDIYAAGSKNCPPMLNKENYVPWLSRLRRYAKSRPNGKLIHKSIINGPYVRQMIPEPGDPNREVPMNKTFHVQTYDELTEKELKQIEADDQAIQTILLGLPKDIYAAVDSCETAQEIWLRVQQMMKGSDIGIQEKKAKGLGHLARNCTVRLRRKDAAYLQTQLLIAQQEEAGIQLQAEEFDLMAIAVDLDEIEKVNANCILMANLQQASTSGIQTDKALVYDSDVSAEVHNYENCYDNEIFNMFTQEEQYTELLEPIPEPHQVPQNDNNVISKVSSMKQSRGTVIQYPANVEETHVLYDSLYNNLAIEVEKVNTVNRKLRETNAELTTELARYKNQEKCFEISQEKYDKLERCYQKSVYQEQCLSKKINSLHLSSGKQITTLNEEISDLNKQLSMEKSTVSTLLKKRKEAAKFVRDFKSLAKESDESLGKHKVLELEIERLLRAVNDWYKKCEECKFDKISHDKAYNDMKQKIKRLKDQLGVLKGKSKDTSCVSDTLNLLSQKLENGNVELEFQVSEQKDTTRGMSAGTKFAKQSILGKPPSSLKTKLYAVSQISKSTISPKVGETYALSNPVTSNSIPTPQESKVVKNDKKVVNSDSNGLSSTGVDNTKTRRPQPRSNTKNDRVPSASKSSCSKNKEVKVEEHPMNLLLSKNKKHMSSECNNIKLATQNVKSKFLRTVRFENDHIAAILGFSDLQWGNILITRVYFVEVLEHNLFSIGQFCDSDLEVAFRRNACFVRNLEGVDLLSGNRTTNLYTINLHEMAFASPICLMARASSTKSWLSHQRLSHLNFDTINDLAKNDLITGLPKFKYHKEHLRPSCEQGTSKRASHAPKPVPNYRQRTDNRSEFKNQVLKEYFDSVGISHQVSSVRTPQQNGVVEQRNRTLVEATRTMLIFSRAPLFLWAEAIATVCFTQNRSIIHRRFHKTPYELINDRKPDISFLHVFGALCYPKNDCDDIGKLGAKGDIGFFIGYSVDSCAYRVYNRRTKKIIETMNVTFDELSAMAFEQSSSKPGLQSMTSG